MEHPGPTSWLEALCALGQPQRAPAGRRAPETTGALAELSRVESWRWIPRLVPLAFSPVSEVAGVARAVLHRLLARVPLSRLPWLEKAVRREQGAGWWNGRYQPGWSELGPEALSASAASLGPAVVSLCTFHPSGWVRAEALAILRTRFAATALPFLVLRLSDWVPAIRSEAVRRCEESVAAGNEAAWARALPLLELVERSSRGRLPQLKASALALLETPAGRAALDAALGDADVLVRAFAFRRVLQAPERTPEVVVAAALLDPDLRIARLGADELSPARFSPALVPALRPGLRSRLAYARRQCLDRLAEIVGEDARAEIMAGLRDRTGIVRGVAQFHAARLRLVPDLETFYVGLLDSGRTALVEVAISGLAELGRRSAWPRIQPFLGADSGRVRSAALRAGVELSPGTLEPALWEALRARQPAVSRLGRALLARRPWDGGHTRRALELALSAGEPDFVRLHAVRLLEVASKWQQVIAWLRILPRVTEPVRGHALEELAWWNGHFNRSSVRPTSDELAAFREGLAAAETVIPAGLRRQLEFVLSAWTGS